LRNVAMGQLSGVALPACNARQETQYKET